MSQISPLRPRARRARLPRGVWTLGFVSLLMDASSETIHGLLPVFLVSVLGASAVSVGLIEGVAEATAALSRVGSGALSDIARRRKPFVLAGYALAAASKPLFPLAGAVSWVLLARFLDRVGKGVRVAPRDALLAELAPKGERGAAFGLRKALDSTGAVIGPLVAVGLMVLFAHDMRAVFWVAVAPAVLAVVLLAVGVREPPLEGEARERVRLDRAALARLGPRFWGLIVVILALHLGQVSEAFMLLRGADVGLEPGFVPFVLAAMSASYAAVAYPAGRLTDARIARAKGRAAVAVAGYAVFVVASLGLAFAATPWQVIAAALVWGVHLGLTKGVMPALVADVSPRALRGTAFGVYHLASAAALLPASIVAGALWEAVAPGAAFLFAAALTALGTLGLGLWAARVRAL